MAKELLEKYNEISKRIDQEFDAYMGQLVSQLFDDSEHQDLHPSGHASPQYGTVYRR